VRFKLFIIIFAIIGLIAVSLFLGYLFGTSQTKKENDPLVFSSEAGKQAIFFTQKIDRLTENENAKKEKATESNKNSSTEVVKDQKKEADKGTKQLKKDEQKSENNEVTSEDKAINKDEKTEDQTQNKDKEAKLPSIEDPHELGKKLKEFYRSGIMDKESKVENKINQKLLKRFYIRGIDANKNRLEQAYVWNEGDKSLNSYKGWNHYHYTILSDMKESFALNQIKKRYGLLKDISPQEHAKVINKIIVDPWYSRVHY
jgi:flagellar biosynthesis GTPase FlhF